MRPVAEDIYSVMPDATHTQHLYDKRAVAYDFFVSTRLYNRVMWGNVPHDYTAFARRAVASNPRGLMLDAACGSMLFTAPVHLEATREVVAFDQSLSMLKRARARLIELGGRVPENVVLLQADLSDLPFRPRSFSTILCMNVLHQFDDAASLIPKLRRLLTGEDSCLYLTSLVLNRRFIGDCYLRVLYNAGEFVRPRTSVGLEKLLVDALTQSITYTTKGNMAYATLKALT